MNTLPTDNIYEALLPKREAAGVRLAFEDQPFTWRLVGELPPPALGADYLDKAWESP